MGFAMSAEPQPGPLEIEGTLRQSDEALAETRDLSIPKDVTQAPTAPRLSGYFLTALIGQGAYAQVWKAWQVRTGKYVAVKVFTQPGGVNWVVLRREVERLIRLDKHPHVVSLLDADLAVTPAYIVMELLEFGSLDSFVKRGESVAVERAARWM